MLFKGCPVKRDVPRSPIRKTGSDGAVGRHRPHYRHTFIAGTISQAAHLHTAFGAWDRDDLGKQWTTWLAVFSPERVSSSSAAKSRGWSWRTQSKSMERIT